MRPDAGASQTTISTISLTTAPDSVYILRRPACFDSKFRGQTMKAKKTKLTAATLSAFLAFGTAALADANGGNEGAGSNTNSNSVKKPSKRHRRGHHKGGKKSK